MPETTLPTTDVVLISFLKVIPDARMRRGIPIPAWYLLLVVVGKPEPFPEPVGSGALCHPPPCCSYRGAGLGALRVDRDQALSQLLNA